MAIWNNPGIPRKATPSVLFIRLNVQSAAEIQEINKNLFTIANALEKHIQECTKNIEKTKHVLKQHISESHEQIFEIDQLLDLYAYPQTPQTNTYINSLLNEKAKNEEEKKSY